MAARRIATLCSLAALLCVPFADAAKATPPAAPPPPPLITNGDFESPTVSGPPEDTVPTGWSADYGGVYLVGSQTWQAASGLQSVEVADNWRLSGDMYQDVPAVQGQRYDLSFAYSADPTRDPTAWLCDDAHAIKHLNVQWAGQALGRFDFDTTGRTASDMGWTTAHVLVDGGAAASRLLFWSGDGPCGPALDHVVLGPAAVGQTSVRLGDPGFIRTGQDATLRATVLGATAGTVPTGAVQFKLDGAPVGDPAPLTGGAAELTLPMYAAHDYTLTAVYEPDSGAFSPSSITGTLSVDKAKTSIGLSATPWYPIAGQPFDLDAAVGVDAPGAGVPSGTIEFSDSAGPLGEAVPLDGEGKAGITLDGLEPGVYYLNAAYSGDDDFYSSNQNLTLSIPRITMGMGMSATPNVITPGAAYTVRAAIFPTVQTDLTPTGTLQFVVDGVSSGDPVPVGPDGVATLALTAPNAAGTVSISAQYGGDEMFGAITGHFRATVRAPRTTATTVMPPRTAPPPTVPRPLSCSVAPRATKLKSAIRGGNLIDVTCTQGAGVHLALRLSATQARRLGIKARTALVIARGTHSDRGQPVYPVRVRFTTRYRARLQHAKRLTLGISASVIDSLGRTLVVTEPFTLRR